MLYNRFDDAPKPDNDVWNTAATGAYRDKLDAATTDWPRGVETLKAAVTFAAPPDALNGEAAAPFKASLGDAVRRALDAHAAAIITRADDHRRLQAMLDEGLSAIADLLVTATLQAKTGCAWNPMADLPMAVWAKAFPGETAFSIGPPPEPPPKAALMRRLFDLVQPNPLRSIYKLSPRSSVSDNGADATDGDAGIVVQND
jgi:hypothetical protein